MVLAVLQGLSKTSIFQLQNVRLVGNLHPEEREQVAAFIQSRIEGKSLFWAKTGVLEKEILTNFTGLGQVSVQKKIGGDVVIKVTTRTPFFQADYFADKQV